MVKVVASAAAMHRVAEIRRTQSVAVARGEVYGLQWGGAVSMPRGTYRIVRDEPDILEEKVRALDRLAEALQSEPGLTGQEDE